MVVLSSVVVPCWLVVPVVPLVVVAPVELDVVSSVVSLLLVVSSSVVPVVDELEYFDVELLVVPVVPVVLLSSLLDSEVSSAEELCVSVEELSFDDDSWSLLLLSEESESLSFLSLSSLAFFLSELSETRPEDEIVDETLLDPSWVCVTVLVTTLVAPSANAIDRIANGVIKGGVRYAMLHSSLFPKSTVVIMTRLAKDFIKIILIFN